MLLAQQSIWFTQWKSTDRDIRTHLNANVNFESRIADTSSAMAILIPAKCIP